MSIAINLFIIVVIIINEMCFFITKMGKPRKVKEEVTLYQKTKQKNGMQWHVVKGKGPETIAMKTYHLLLRFNLNRYE